MTEGTGGKDREAGGMTEGTVWSGRNRTTTSQCRSPPAGDRGPPCPMRGHTIPPLSFPMFSIALHPSRCFQSPDVIPDIVNRESMLFPCRVTQMKGQKRKTLDSR